MTSEARIAAALAFCDQADALTVAPESWAELTPLEVIHRLAAIVRQRLTPPAAPTREPLEVIGPTADYAHARAALAECGKARAEEPAHLSSEPEESK